MVSYYITYGEPPPRRFRWLRVLAILAAILIAGALAGAIWMAVTGDDAPDAAVPAESHPEAVPFTEVIPAMYAAGTNTVYVVDLSGSIAEAGHLEAVKLALSTLALSDAGGAVENSRAALMTFGGDAEPETVMDLVMLNDAAAQADWLTRVDALETTKAGGSFIYDAVDSAYQQLQSAPADGRENVIVVLSDGIDGGVGECRIAPADFQAEYCVGDSGDPVPCGDVGSQSGIIEMCDAIPSTADPYQLMQKLANDGLTTHTIAYGSTDAHLWLEQVADATGGAYTIAGR